MKINTRRNGQKLFEDQLRLTAFELIRNFCVNAADFFIQVNYIPSGAKYLPLSGKNEWVYRFE